MNEYSNVYFVAINCRLERRCACDLISLMSGILEDYPVSTLPVSFILKKMSEFDTQADVIRFYNQLGDDYGYGINYIYVVSEAPIYYEGIS